MLLFLAEWCLRWEAWLILAFAMGGLQMMMDLDVSFFGGVTVGAALTAAIVGIVVPENGPSPLHWGMAIVICAALSFVAAWALKKYIGDPKKNMPPDVNEAPYRGDDD